MARDMYGPMTGASAWMMTITWDAPRLLLLWAMWAAMMAGMMLPTITPMLLLYARAMRNRARDPRPVAHLRDGRRVPGTWALFSVGATALQRWLASLFLMTPMMGPRRRAWPAGLLFVPAAYQLTPFKTACLDRVPVADCVAVRAMARRRRRRL